MLMGDRSDSWGEFWQVFRYYLLVNSTEEPTYLLTRQHMGSTIAFGVAAYNTFLLRQKIIKNAIHLTKSNNPRVVVPAGAVVSVLYFAGLSLVWHIPSFFSELAVRVYCSAQNATTTVLFRDQLRRRIFSSDRLDYILKDYS